MTPEKKNRWTAFLKISLVALVSLGNSCQEGCDLLDDGTDKDEQQTIVCGVSPGPGVSGLLTYAFNGKNTPSWFEQPEVEGDPVDGEPFNILCVEVEKEGVIAQAGSFEIARRVLLVGGRMAQVLNLTSGAVEARVELTGFATRVSISEDNDYAVVSVVGSREAPDGVEIIEVSTMTRTGTVRLTAECNPLAVSFITGTNDFAVSCNGEGVIRFFSVNGGAGGEQIRELTGCERARDVEFTADGERGLFACMDSIWVYDVLSNSIAQRIAGFGDIGALAVRLDGTRAYATAQRDDKRFLAVVNMQTYEIAAETDLGDTRPRDVFMGSDDEQVYVIGSDNSLLMVDPEGVVQRVEAIPEFPLFGVAVAVAATD